VQVEHTVYYCYRSFDPVVSTPLAPDLSSAIAEADRTSIARTVDQTRDNATVLSTENVVVGTRTYEGSRHIVVGDVTWLIFSSPIPHSPVTSAPP
jgi:hypothetical protein